MAAAGSFPLLVQGSWGLDPPKNLHTKLQMYFQSAKRSGGGECEVRAEPGSPGRFLVLFSPEDVRPRVLQKKDHELVWPGKGTFQLTVWLPKGSDEAPGNEEKIPTEESKTKEDVKGPSKISDASEELDAKNPLNSGSEDIEDIHKENENVPSLVAFENVKANVTDMMLTLLVENISGLTSDDFQVEIIQDFDVAVITFKKYIDTTKFVDDCIRYHLVEQLQLSPRVLEVTKTIRVENLPPGIDDYQLQLYFENPLNGGGRVTSIECFPEESSALIEFCDRKVLDTIMAKKQSFKKMPLSVFPYYTSLGTALYGKEKPLIKLPAPFQESLDSPLSKFFQKKNHLIKEMDDKMRHCHCELAWSEHNSKVTIRPAATLFNQGRRRIRTWQEDASKALCDIMSKYRVSSLKVEPVVWDAIKNGLAEDRVWIEFDTLTQTVTLAGKSEDVQNLDSKMKELIESTTQKIRREEASLRERVAISPGRYFLLQHMDVMKHLPSECPEMEICYDDTAHNLCFKGPRADVYKVKCEIQEKLYAMAQKTIQVSPEVFEFLRQVDYKKFSKFLFIEHKILAVFKPEDRAVLLIGCSSEVLEKAQTQMHTTLTFKYIEVEDKEVLSGKNWKRQVDNLQKKHNASTNTVAINELTSGSKVEVLIVGHLRAVNEIHTFLFDFLEKYSKIERLIEVKPSLVLNYLKAEKKAFWSEMRKANVQVIFNPEHKRKGILLIGCKSKVLEHTDRIKQVRDSVLVKSVSIDKPGAREFFQDKAWYWKRESKRMFGCFIELQKEEEMKAGGPGGEKCLTRKDVAPGVVLIVQQGNLAQCPVDVVVNAANEELKLSGGLAAALSKVAGPELQADCNQIVKTEGRLLPGCAVISKAGKLPCRSVIHAVGPRWRDDEAPRCVFLLRRVVEKCLLLADQSKYRSIAIPAISSGIFGFPLRRCVETIVSAIKESFQYKQDGCTLKEVYLVDTSQKTAEAFAEAVKVIFKDAGPEAASPPDTTPPPQAPAVETAQSWPCLMSPGGLRLLLVNTGVQNAKTQVVVNSIPSDLHLSAGPLSRALLESAGPKLQEELDEAGQAMNVGVGTILPTSGCNLPCQFVLHVVAPPWKGGSASSQKIMEDIIRDCLDTTEKLSLQSIAFPAIGTGNLGFPKTILADLIISEVLKFSSKNQLKALKEVHFCLHPSDHENIQAFSDEFTRRNNGDLSSKIPKAEDTEAFYGAISSPALGVYEMMIGPIFFQVASGDITKETADVIVNSTSQAFTLKSGVSKAILECAGKNVETECSRLAQQGKNEYIVTEGGLLRCKNIIHVAGGKKVKTSVSCVLKECEKRKYSSICLPAIGTGNAQKDPSEVAEDIIDAIEDFVRKKLVQSVKRVKVVIFLPKILDVFYAIMKKREGSQALPRPSMISKLASFFVSQEPASPKGNPLVLEKKTELAVFQVCGENRKCVDSTISWIQELIKKEQFNYTSKDECIKDFDRKKYQKLNELQKRLNITISVDQRKSLIEVTGLSRDVMQARDEIEDMIKSVRLAKEKEDRADCICDFIEWQYNENNTFHRFDKMTNLQLEDARRAKQKSTVVSINNNSYTVDLNTYTATGPNGDTVTVQRLSKSEVKIPEHWSDMKQQYLQEVVLNPSDPEYNAVASKFNQTCSQFVIEKIARIQNSDLWNSYQAKKKIMDAKNGQTINERQLFHGTDADSVPHVNRNGFNRSYAGKNAVAYGKGTYFAVDASYSANDTYSRPDGNGKKHMYYVRVLTGIYTNGHNSLIVPPSKNPQNPTDLYDTVTDNVKNPRIFVVFYDYQAYPEYLITFRR